MIQPGVYNIKLQRRADYSVQLQFKDSNNAAINLTGYTVVAQAWDVGRTTKYADFGVDYISRENGTVKLSLDHTSTANFPNQLHYDVMLITMQDVREYYLEGSITVSEGYSSPL